MSKTKAEKPEEAKLNSRIYKGYDIEWLRKESDHPDYYLVAEYDKLSQKEGE